MPLARISIKTATKVALATVAMRCVVRGRGRRPGRYVVRRRDTHTTHVSERMSITEARRRLRVDRIFVALMRLGIESTRALTAASAAADTEVAWASVVGDYIERLEVTKPSCLYPTCDCSIVPREGVEFSCAKGFL